MFNSEKFCLICGIQMEHRLFKHWSEEKGFTDMHEWSCSGDADAHHTLKFYEPSTQEYLEWEKHK